MSSRIRRLRRRITVLITPAIYAIVTAAPAWAVAGATAGALWIGVTDSSGVPVGSYGLSLNTGSLADPAAAPESLAQNWFYSAFLTIIGLAVWLIDSVLNFGWLSIIADPIDFVGRQISAIALSPAFILAVGTIAAAFIAVNVMRGNLSRAAAQIATAVILVFLAVTVAHKPISDLVGPNGALAMGRDIGIELSTELSGKAATGQQAVNEVTTTLADHFARTPTLVWNWGANIDKAPYNCGDTWSAAIKAGEIATVKDKVQAGCPYGEQLHDYAMNNSTRMNVTGFFAVVFALCVLLVFGYLCYQVVILALSALFWAIVALVALITGIIPGAAQGLAIKAALDAVFALVGMTGYVAILGITGHLTAAMFNLTGDDVVMAMPLVSLLLVALLLALRRVRGGLVAVRDRAAQAVSAFSGGTQSQQSDTATAPARRSSLLNRLDPLTAVPHATDKAKKAAGTATRVGLSVAVPEAAPLIGATEQMHSRLTAQTLRKNRRDKHSAAPEQPVPAPRPPQSPTGQSAGPARPAASQPATAATATNHHTTAAQRSTTTTPPAHPAARTSAANPAAPPPTSDNLSRLTTAPATPLTSGADPYAPAATHNHPRLATDPTPAADTAEQVPLLCGAKTSRGDHCLNPADSCQHHPSAPAPPTPAPIHPAILTLAGGHTPERGAENTEATPAPPRDLRADTMARPDRTP